MRYRHQNFGPIPTKFGKILPLIKLFNRLINLKNPLSRGPQVPLFNNFPTKIGLFFLFLSRPINVNF